MKSLLNNLFAPVTLACAFLRSPFHEVADEYFKLRKRQLGEFECRYFSSDLRAALPYLEPLNDRRTLVISTRSNWTAMFFSATAIPDMDGPAAAGGSRRHSCDGLSIACVEDTMSREGKGLYGSVSFLFYSDEGWKNRQARRAIQVTNDSGRWVFVNYGEPFPFEMPEKYEARKVKDRFTDGMLDHYCKSVGVDFFNEHFYGNDCALIHYQTSRVAGTLDYATYASVQKELGFT